MQESARHTSATGIDLLIDRLDAAVRTEGVPDLTHEVKRILEDLIGRSAIRLPEPLREPRRDCYARRLVHRDGERRFTVVAMIWGPGQHTELHDHAGMWCVESVLQGELDVTQFDLVEERDGRCRFVRQSKVRAGVGEAGCLIPPYEYHMLENPLKDRTSITLHVYGGEMERCNLYLPESDDWWRRTAKRLEYDPA